MVSAGRLAASAFVPLIPVEKYDGHLEKVKVPLASMGEAQVEDAGCHMIVTVTLCVARFSDSDQDVQRRDLFKVQTYT